MTARRAAETTSIPREIERKYLLSGVPPVALTKAHTEMAQGYIPGTNIHERLRREVDGVTVRWVRTIKLGRGIERVEVEEEVDEPLFGKLWELTAGARVEKHRHRVPDGDLVWEVDVFTDRELVLAEVELPSVDHPIVIPAWLEPFVVREVTNEAAYLNLRLAR